MNKNHSDKYGLEVISEYLSIILVIAGLLIIIGWIFNIAVLKSFSPPLKPISPISAILFVLLGISIWLMQNKRINKLNTLITRFLLFIVAFTSFIILLEYILGLNLGVNSINNINFALMSFISALNFLLTSIALFILDLEIDDKYPAQYIMLIVAFLTLFTIAGYIYGVSEIYQLYFYISISVFSIILFVLTIAAVLGARPDNGLVKTLTSDLLGSAFARRILPSVIFIPLLLGLLAFIGQRFGFYDIAYATAIMVILTIVFLVILVWSSMKSINDADYQRLKTKEDLRKLVAELKHSNRELESFAYITSHDLQEPLRSIISYAQLIEMRYKGQLDSDADEFIDFMVGGALRMKDMIQGLLDYSRVDTQGGEFKDFRAEEVLNVVSYNLKVSIEECRAEITHDPLPVIFADESQITRVFQNLIWNALKFRKEGIPPEIHVSARKEE